ACPSRLIRLLKAGCHREDLQGRHACQLILYSPFSILHYSVVGGFCLSAGSNTPKSRVTARVTARVTVSTLSAALGKKEVSGHLRMVKLATYLQGEQKEFVLSKQVLGVKGIKMKGVYTFDPSSQSVLPLSHQILATWS